MSEAGKSRTVHSMKQGSTKHVNIEDGEEEGDAYESTQQRDARLSDSQNHEFARTLNERSKQPARNIIHDNKTLARSMQTTNRGPQERLIVPEGVEQFMYGNQKLNVWEWQKEQLRKKVEQDPSNYYTYSKEHLSLAFPLVNEN